MKRLEFFASTCVMIACFGLGFASGWAAPGQPDNTFQQQGTIDAPICAVVVDSHTNIWIGGRFLNVYGSGNPYLACLNADGTLNTNLPNNVIHGSIGVVHSLDVDDLDTIYVGGANGVTRLIPSGQSWVNDAAFQANATAVVRRGDTIAVSRGIGSAADAIFVGGAVYDYTNGNGTVVANAVVLNPDGTRGFGFNVPADVASGTVAQIRYVSPCLGCGTNTLSFPFLLLAGTFGVRLTDATGLVYGSYSSGYLYSCAAMRSLPTINSCGSPYGEVVGGGFFHAGYFANSDQYNNFTLDRFGGTVPNWFQDIKSTHFPQDNGFGIAAVETFEGGDIVIAGTFSTIHGVNRANFAHLFADGTVDPFFTDASDIPVFAMARQPDGKFILVGENTSSPFVGKIQRRMGLDPFSPVAFTSSPGDQTLYVGESTCLQPGVSGTPRPLSYEWIKDNVPLPGQTNLALCINNATNSDAGDYRLRANVFCGNPPYLDSAIAHVTVLTPPPPPANDMFSNAFLLTGASAIGTSYIRSSTVETGEPNHAGQDAGRSVWWTWTAPFSGRTVLDVSGCDFPAATGVYRGAVVSSLTLVTNGFDTNLAFTVVSGTTYRLAVGGTPPVGSPGNVLIRINPIAIVPGTLVVSNGVSFQVVGPWTGSVVIETATTLNPPNWQPIATNSMVNGTTTFTDLHPTTEPARFYRVRLP